MRQGWSFTTSCAAIALIACAALAPHPAHAARSAAGAKPNAASSPRARVSLRQFTGYVTAVDKNSLTVEKRGKNPTTKAFTRHAEMSTTGDVEKEARVTVYYRDEGGHAVAHRVVVRAETANTGGGR